MVVSDVAFELPQGQTLALVGESGAGKSTTCRMALRLVEPDSGSIEFAGEDLLALSQRELRAKRQSMQMIFQDPHSSLDPHQTIGDSVSEPLRIHTTVSKAERRTRAIELLDQVGLAKGYVDRHPARLSGGQLQRVAIARALALNPQMIVCDEPVAALDVSVRAQVLNLMSELQADLGLSYLLVSHDLVLVRALADAVVVMKDGRVVEQGPASQIFEEPSHAYTQQLLGAILPPRWRERVSTI